MTIELPWPPSVNKYWISGTAGRGGRPMKYLSERGKQYRNEVIFLARSSPRAGDSRVRVVIDARPPDRRKRDLDNLLKSTLDALEAAEVYDSDEQIDDLRICRGAVEKGGRLLVTVEAIG